MACPWSLIFTRFYGFLGFPGFFHHIWPHNNTICTFKNVYKLMLLTFAQQYITVIEYFLPTGILPIFEHSDRTYKHGNMKKMILSNKSVFLHHFSVLLIKLEKNELCHLKTFAKTKPQISCAVTAQLISAFVFATCMDRTMSLLVKSKISSFWLSSVTVQAGICQTWSEILKTNFFASWLK